MTMQFKVTAEARLIEITGAPELEGTVYEHGRTWVCDVCGTRVREGQPHRTDVWPSHATYEALEVRERLPREEKRC
jgi:hypothetical protein